jgi:hypothetical protein
MGIVFKFDDHSPEIRALVAENAKLALSMMGEVVEKWAKRDCPVDTGLLRNSITHTGAGQQMSQTYHASYGSNRKADGSRYSASSMKAGSVGFGSISGVIGEESEWEEYVGTNVEYAPAVEFGDYTHKVGKAHFLRDGAQDHVEEIREVAQAVINRM